MYLAAILEQRRQGVSATGEATTITMPSGLGGTDRGFLRRVLPQAVVAHDVIHRDDDTGDATVPAAAGVAAVL